MGFSGSGSSVTRPHTHSSLIVNDGGELNMDNITQASLTAGDIVYSSGTALQRVPIGNASDQMRVNAGATAPEWYTPSAASSTWTVEADVTISGGAAALQSGTFSANDKFIRILGYVALSSSGVAGIRFNGAGASQEYALRYSRNNGAQVAAGTERSLGYVQGVTTSNFCYFQMDFYNGHSAGADKLVLINSIMNVTTGNTAPESIQSFSKYYGGSYVTTAEVVDGNAGTSVNCANDSRLLILSSG